MTSKKMKGGIKSAYMPNLSASSDDEPDDSKRNYLSEQPNNLSNNKVEGTSIADTNWTDNNENWINSNENLDALYNIDNAQHLIPARDTELSSVQFNQLGDRELHPGSNLLYAHVAKQNDSESKGKKVLAMEDKIDSVYTDEKKKAPNHKELFTKHNTGSARGIACFVCKNLPDKGGFQPGKMHRKYLCEHIFIMRTILMHSLIFSIIAVDIYSITVTLKMLCWMMICSFILLSISSFYNQTLAIFI